MTLKKKVESTAVTEIGPNVTDSNENVCLKWPCVMCILQITSHVSIGSEIINNSLCSPVKRLILLPV